MKVIIMHRTVDYLTKKNISMGELNIIQKELNNEPYYIIQ
jgi:hypothetical protein